MNASNLPIHTRVLIIEDHTAVVRIVWEALDGAGYSTKQAIANDQRQVQRARKFRPHVLCVGSSAGAAQAAHQLAMLREAAGLEHVPVILLSHSQHGAGASQIMELEDSRTRVLHGPFSQRLLLACIQELCAQKTTQETTRKTSGANPEELLSGLAN